MSWQPKRLTRDQLAERRAEAIRLLENGKMKQVQIAHELGVTAAAISQWKRKLKEHGAQALERHKASGRPPKLKAVDQQALLKTLDAGAVAAGFPTEQWTQARVAQVIERDFGVHYHPHGIGRILDDLGWSVQKPETRALERDEVLIQAWLNQDWPRLKKSRAARRRNRL